METATTNNSIFKNSYKVITMNDNQKVYKLPIVAPGVDDNSGFFTGEEVHVVFPNDLRLHINHDIGEEDESDIGAIMFFDEDTGDYIEYSVAAGLAVENELLDPNTGNLVRGELIDDTMDNSIEDMVYAIRDSNIIGTRVRRIYGEERLVIEVRTSFTVEVLAELGSIAFETRWLELQSERSESGTPIQIEDVKAAALEPLRNASKYPGACELMLEKILDILQADVDKYPEVQSCIDALSNILEEV